MRDITRNRIYKKHNMYAILSDSQGNKPGGCGGIALGAILHLGNIKIKRKDKTTIVFDREGYMMMYHLETKDNLLTIRGNIYATSRMPQECIDDFFVEFRQGVKNRFDELLEEGRILAEKSRKEHESCFIIPQETLDMVLD